MTLIRLMELLSAPAAEEGRVAPGWGAPSTQPCVCICVCVSVDVQSSQHCCYLSFFPHELYQLTCMEGGWWKRRRDLGWQVEQVRDFSLPLLLLPP